MKSKRGKKLIFFSLGPVVSAAVSFITIPITTFFISPAEYGKASMFLLVQTIITTFLYFGLDQAYTREYYEQKDRKNLIQNAMVLPFLSATIASLVLLTEAHQISKWLLHDENEILPVMLLCINTYSLIFERFFLLSIRMEEKALCYSIYTIFIRLAVLIVILVIMLAGVRNYLVIVNGTLIGQILADLFIIIACRQLLSIKNFRLDINLIRKLCAFGLPIFIAFFIETIFNITDRFMLNVFSNYKEIGLYTTALKIASLLKIVQTSFTSFWIPTAYRWHNENRSISQFQLVSDSITFLFCFLFIILLLMKNIFRVFFTNDYQEIIYIFPFLCFLPMLYTISETTTLGIVFSRKTSLNIYVSVAALCVNFFLAFVLIPQWGARGASVGLGLSYLAYYLMRTSLSNRYWEGLKVKHQLIMMSIVFALAFYNTFFSAYSFLINTVGLLLLFLGNRGLLKKIQPFIENFIHKKRRG